MKPLAFALALSLAATPGLAQSPDWAGVWAAEPEWCSNRGKPTDAQPIDLTDTEIRGYESACDIIAYDPTGAGASWSVITSCSGEGSTWEESLLFMLAPSSETLHIWYEEGFLISYARCQ